MKKAEPGPPGLLLRADGTTLKVYPKRRKFTLEELQALVGGYIERVQLAPNIDLIANEEGQILGLPLNQMATAMARTTIVGNVFIVRRGSW